MSGATHSEQRVWAKRVIRARGAARAPTAREAAAERPRRAPQSHFQNIYKPQAGRSGAAAAPGARAAGAREPSHGGAWGLAGQ